MSRRQWCSTWERLSFMAPMTPTRDSPARQERHDSPLEVKRKVNKKETIKEKKKVYNFLTTHNSRNLGFLAITLEQNPASLSVNIGVAISFHI